MWSFIVSVSVSHKLGWNRNIHDSWNLINYSNLWNTFTFTLTMKFISKKYFYKNEKIIISLLYHIYIFDWNIIFTYTFILFWENSIIHFRIYSRNWKYDTERFFFQFPQRIENAFIVYESNKICKCIIKNNNNNRKLCKINRKRIFKSSFYIRLQHVQWTFNWNIYENIAQRLLILPPNKSLTRSR